MYTNKFKVKFTCTHEHAIKYFLIFQKERLKNQNQKINTVNQVSVTVTFI